MSNDFPRGVRLLSSADFQRVFANPDRSSDRFFTVLGYAGGNTTARLGLAIAKKQLRKAVQRNRIKRLARDVFRLQRAGLAPLDIVVMARGAAADADNGRLRHSLARHFKRLAGNRHD